MLRADKVMQCIRGNLGYAKPLNEWLEVINDNLPSMARLTPRELAKIFFVLRAKGENNKIDLSVSYREGVPSYYCFNQA